MPILTTELKISKEGEVKATFRIPADIMKKLKYMSIDKNIPVNTLVIEALTDLLNKRDDKGKK
jgi:predicted HicB family RNase H-like nuclease